MSKISKSASSHIPRQPRDQKMYHASVTGKKMDS